MLARMDEDAVIDFTKVDDNFEPLDRGVYSASVYAIELRAGPAGPYINWEFIVTDPIYEGRHLWDVTSLSTKSLWRLKQRMARFGHSLEQIGVEELLQLIQDQIVGQPCQVVVDNEMYQGTKRNRVTDVVTDAVDVVDETRDPTAAEGGEDPALESFF